VAAGLHAQVATGPGASVSRAAVGCIVTDDITDDVPLRRGDLSCSSCFRRPRARPPGAPVRP
jgi:hypothetical protein